MNLNRAVDSGFLLAVLLVISVFLVIAIFAHPIIDDYNFGCYVQRWGFWGGQWQRFNTWTGRFTFNFLAHLFVKLTDLRAGWYWTAPVLYLLSIWGAILLLISRFIPPPIKLSARVAWSSILFAFYLSHLPDIRPMYWMTSISTYQGGTVLSLLLMVAMLGYRKESSPGKKFLTSAGAIVAAFFACGSSETLMVVITYFLLAGTALCWWIKHPKRWFWTMVAGSALTSSLIVYFAPGNAVRLAEFPQAGNPAMVIPALGRVFVEIIKKWFLSPGFLLVTILFLPFAQEIGRLIFPEKGRAPRWMFLIPLIWLGGLLISGVPTAWAKGELLPIGRSRNPVFLLFLLGWFFSVVIWLPHIFTAEIDLKIVMRRASRLVKLILIVVLFTTWNTTMALEDLFIYGSRYRGAQQKRGELIRSALARGEKSIQVPKIVELPRAIFFVDFTEDPAYWSNKTYAYAHGLHSIRIFEANNPHRKGQSTLER